MAAHLQSGSPGSRHRAFVVFISTLASFSSLIGPDESHAQTTEPDSLSLVLGTSEMREVVGRIRAVDPEHALVFALDGYDNAQIYLHNRARITIPELRPYKTTLLESPRHPTTLGDFADRRDRAVDQNRTQIPDPFDIERLESLGYSVLSRNSQAESHYRSAVQQLSRAVQSDPMLREAYATLFAVHAAHADTNDLVRLAAAMRKRFPEDANSMINSGYASYAAGRLSEADYFFHKGLEIVPEDDRSVFQDVTRILNKAQRDQGEGDPRESPDAFWTSRDPRYMSHENERQLEHYARLVYADLLFSEPSLGLRGWDSDRGNTYVRFGRPDTTFFMTNMVSDCSEREGSLYMNAITNFQVFEYSAFRFVFGNPGNIGDADFASNALVPSLNEFPLYSPCSDVRAFVDAYGSNLDYVERSDNIIKQLPDLFDYSPGATRIFVPYQASVLKGTGEADMYVAFGVPISLPEGRPSINLELSAGAFLVSPSEGIVAENRLSAGTVAADDLTFTGGQSYWNALHLLSAGRGDYTLSVEFESTANNVVGYQRSILTVPDYSSGEFMMSDLVMARLVEEIGPDEDMPIGSMVRHNVHIHPAISSLYLRNEPIYFYFELYNLSKGPDGGTRYNVEAILFEAEDASDVADRIVRNFRRTNSVGVSVSTSETGSESEDFQYLMLDARDLEPGPYILAVRVTDSVGNGTAMAYRALVLE